MHVLHGFAPRGVVRRLLARADAPWAVRLRRFPVVGRLVHSLSYRLAPPGARQWVQVEAGGARGLSLLVDPRYDAKYWRGDVEPELQALLPTLVRPGGVAWDVGAHIGFFTLMLARSVGPTGTVVAFEPDAWSVGALEAAVQRNALTNVEIRPVAVWSTMTEIGFEHRKDSAVGAHGAVSSEAVMTVSATTLDREWSGAAPDLVKIDVEGAEEHVLLGATRLLAEARPTIVCEVHTTRRGNAELPFRIRSLLEAAGYDVRELDPDRSPLHMLGVPR